MVLIVTAIVMEVVGNNGYCGGGDSSIGDEEVDSRGRLMINLVVNVTSGSGAHTHVSISLRRRILGSSDLKVSGALRSAPINSGVIFGILL
jgi:hypothetical protein